MPVYEYRCLDCRTKFEQLIRRPSDIPKCPECYGSDVDKLVSMFSSPRGYPVSGSSGDGIEVTHFGRVDLGGGWSGKADLIKIPLKKKNS